MARRDDDDEDDRDDDYEDDRPRKKKKGISDEEKQMAMFCHLGLLIGGFIIPLVIWMMKKEESKFIDKQGKEAINFSISTFIWSLVIILPTCGLGGLVMGPLWLYWTIMAGLEANKGKMYRYPMTIRFLQ
jgi:uncharacterized Tic20 family protein